MAWPPFLNYNMQVLKELPNEMDNRFMPTPHEQRLQIAHKLGVDSHTIFPYLELVFSGLRASVPVMTELFKCLASWLNFGGEGTIAFAESPLLPGCFDALVQENGDLARAVNKSPFFLVQGGPAVRARPSRLFRTFLNHCLPAHVACGHTRAH